MANTGRELDPQHFFSPFSALACFGFLGFCFVEYLLILAASGLSFGTQASNCCMGLVAPRHMGS